MCVPMTRLMKNSVIGFQTSLSPPPTKRIGILYFITPSMHNHKGNSAHPALNYIAARRERTEVHLVATAFE